ncbi:MAG: GntR family transcriptional regulator [Mycobacterium sp.]|nr:GntR family transcriptional regulator [Mycobacterium sp.]
MALSPAQRSGTVSDAIFTQLADEIFSGRWPANGPAPSERDLAATLQVNRHSVREALRRLQQAGLLEITHGGKTRVLDWRTHAGIDMLGALAAAGVVEVSTALGDVAVMRRTIGADAARLCALKADEAQLAAVSEAANTYPESGDIGVMRDADLEFWTAVVIGSGNLSYRLALNTLVRGADEIGRELYMGVNAEMFLDRAGHLELAAAIVARDADTARQLAYKQLSQLVELLGADA